MCYTYRCTSSITRRNEMRLKIKAFFIAVFVCMWPSAGRSQQIFSGDQPQAVQQEREYQPLVFEKGSEELETIIELARAKKAARGLQLTAAENPFRPMFGSEWESSFIRTPLGLWLNTSEFENTKGEKRRKKADKTMRWLRNHGVPEHIITGYGDNSIPSVERFANEMLADPLQLAKWADEQWIKAGSPNYPGYYHITITAVPFWVPEAGQWRGEWNKNGNISVVIGYVQNAVTDPSQAWFKTYPNELNWAFTHPR